MQEFREWSLVRKLGNRERVVLVQSVSGEVLKGRVVMEVIGWGAREIEKTWGVDMRNIGEKNVGM